ncbi:DUF1800 domain-containing protein [Oxalobacteraceae bacterium CAVE-383]|nr:DUF1800 domain-containing protein [Oxalobacteraceae bacterium CAVE-383]
MRAPSRIPLLPVLSLVLMLASLSAPAPSRAQTAQPDPSPNLPLSADERALHVLNRLAYGPAPGDLAQIRREGVKAYIDAQLNPASIPLPADLQARLDSLPSATLTPSQAFVQYGPPSFAADNASVEEKNRSRQRAARELTPQTHQARIWLAAQSPRQLQEVMTEFWFNHFNVFEGKGWDRYWIADFENKAIRPNALGNFRQLLGAVAHHPAMLFYLDNWLSSGVGAPEARGRFKGLNENYARELMELHTLGVDGGYTQSDVVAMARVLSGWTIDVQGMQHGREDAGFVFNPRRHDSGPKVLLGQTLQMADGAREGERALDLLAAHPSTARFISTKLVEYFVSDQPDPALVDRLARRYQASGGDIKAVLRELFDSPQFWDRKNYQSQFKTPYQYVISSLRASGTPVRNVKPVDNILYQLGMPLYGWLTPEGYSYAQSVWLNPDALLRRINFAATLANGRTPIAREAGVAIAALPPSERPQAPDPRQMLETLGPAFSASALEQIDAAPHAAQAGLILGSPGFMKR